MKQCSSLLTGVVAAGLLAMVPAVAQNQSSANRLTGSDTNFATRAAQGGMAEVQLGKLAAERAASRDVKSFGERMVTDHTKANDELKSVAAKKGLTLPTSVDAKDQATYDRLSRLNGAAFDRAYIRDMVADHRKDVNEFKNEASNGADPDMKAFAGKTLPVLQEHLQLAENTESKIKNGK